MLSKEVVERLLAEPDHLVQQQILRDRTAALEEQDAAALKGQADRLLRDDLQRCLQVTRLLLYLADLTHNPSHRALGLLAQANAHAIGLGEYPQAVELYTEAGEIYRALGRVVDQAKSQIGKLWALASLGRYAEAFETGQWVGQILEAHAQWLPLAKLTVNLGVIYGRLGEDTRALAMFDRARDLYAQLGSEGEPFIPRVEYDRALILRNLGRFEESIRASQQAMARALHTDQRIDWARAQQSLAFTYFVLGRYNETLELLDEVRSIFLADSRRRDAILVELFISDCLLQLRRFSDVLEKCRRVRELFVELGMRLEVGQAILNEAVAYAGLVQPDSALVSLAEARQLFAEENNPVWMAIADLERAALLYRQGRFEDSWLQAQRCAEVFRAHRRLAYEAHADLIAARAAIAWNQPDKALPLVRQVLLIGKNHNIPSLTYQGHQLLGLQAQAQGDLAAALAEHEQAIQELERLRGRLMVEFRADFLEDKQLLYEDAVSLALALNQPHKGLEFAERAKSRALLDLLAYRLDLSLYARSPEDQPLVEALRRLRVQRDQLYLRWQADERPQERNWAAADEGWQQVQQNVLGLEKQILELWHTLLIRNADYAREASLWQVRVEPIQPYLPDRTLLIEYFAIRGQLVAFLVTRQTVAVSQLAANLSKIQTLLQFFWLNLKTARQNAPGQRVSLATNARGILRQLHTLLIAPLQDQLASFSRLIIVPHGVLHYLPFHALHDGEQYLLEGHEISYLPGASFLRYCREARPVAAETMAMGYSSRGRLPYAAQEAHTVARLMSGRAFVEGEATLAQLRTMAGECRILHLATHGDFRPDNPLFSGLVLADGWLTTLDIFSLRLKASLVTLSACQTGRSVVAGGDELLGLTRAFLSTGTASLLLSLWPVEDRSTARLMEFFYRQLEAGADKGAALRQAQLQFIQHTAEADADLAADYPHPYFWAPFYLVGDTGPL